MGYLTFGMFPDHIETSYVDGLGFLDMNPRVGFVRGGSFLGSFYMSGTYLPFCKRVFGNVNKNRFPLKCVVRISITSP